MLTRRSCSGRSEARERSERDGRLPIPSAFVWLRCGVGWWLLMVSRHTPRPKPYVLRP